MGKLKPLLHRSCTKIDAKVSYVRKKKIHSDIVVGTTIAQQQLQCSISVCIGCIQAQYYCAGHPVHRTHSIAKMWMTYTLYCA